MKGILTDFDLGPSFSQSRPVSGATRSSVSKDYWNSFSHTNYWSDYWALLGIYAALNQHKLSDTVATLIAFSGIAIPKFIISIVILYFLAFVWHSPYIGAIQSPEYILQGYWDWNRLVDFFFHVWPILLISIWAGQSYILRMMRGNLLDVMKMQYIETAKAKGLSKNRYFLFMLYPMLCIQL